MLNGKNDMLKVRDSVTRANIQEMTMHLEALEKKIQEQRKKVSV